LAHGNRALHEAHYIPAEAACTPVKVRAGA
jgi:hypothetical protein